MELFMAGQLKASYDKFDKVLALVPVKSKVWRRSTCPEQQGGQPSAPQVLSGVGFKRPLRVPRAARGR